MSSPDEKRTTAFYDAIASRYDNLVDDTPGDAWTRDAFRALVLETVPPGSLLLDFGCGTGTDALWYAQHGFRVVAYDNSPGMVEQLARKCAAEIDKGSVIPRCYDYKSFLTRGVAAQPDAIVSNFAVLSAIPDLAQLFTAFGRALHPGGRVIVSILNPVFWKDMVHGWWWRSFMRSLGKGTKLLLGRELEAYWHTAPTVVAAASPFFVKLGQASPGFLVARRSAQHEWVAPRSLAERLERKFWKAYPFRNLGQYIFLVFRRCG